MWSARSPASSTSSSTTTLLFTHEEQLAAFRAAGFEVEHDEEGLMGRGLYIGLKPER